jgi:hypothetical protein
LPSEQLGGAEVSREDNSLCTTFPTARWLFQPAAFDDIVAVLSEALGQEWEVERETDCQGEVSIILLPTIDDGTKPAFILFEKSGRTRVGTIMADKWQCDRGFESFGQGVDAVVAQARASASRRRVREVH